MTAPNYGPWIAHNAMPDSTCPPDTAGKRVQVQCANETRLVAEGSRPFNNLDVNDWRMDGGFSIIAYRILIEPVQGEIVLTGDNHPQCGWTFGPASLGTDTHTLRLPTLDGTLIPGEYIGPDGAVVKVEAV